MVSIKKIQSRLGSVLLFALLFLVLVVPMFSLVPRVSALTDPTIYYIFTWGYPGGRLDPSGQISRGGTVRMFTYVGDVETPADELTVQISYKVKTDVEWTGPLSTSWEPDYGGYWYYDWVIPSGAVAGVYDVKVDVSDPDGGSASNSQTDMFEVVNIDPTIDNVFTWGYPGGRLDPLGVVSHDGIVRMFTYVSDAETSSDSLTVYISYKLKTDVDWSESVLASWESGYGGYWYYDWTIPSDATLGIYDVKVEVTDPDGGSAWSSPTDMFEVANTNPTINYVLTWGYPGGLLDPGKDINRGYRVRMFSQIVDLETLSSSLTVTLRYKAQSDVEWTTPTASWEPVWGGGYWYYDWAPTDATLGLYDVKVEVSDANGGTATSTTTGSFNVVNYPILLADSWFDASVDSTALIANSTSQDWYESRNDNPSLLTLNTDPIAGNTGKKAALKNYGGVVNSVYLTQEFPSAQTGTFSVQFDINIDRIEDYLNYDRTCHIFIGNDWNANGIPLDTARERYVLLAFYDSTPSTDGDIKLVARTLSTTAQSWLTTSLWPVVASGLSYDTWYTVKVTVNYVAGTYDVTFNGVTTTFSKMDIYNTSTDPAIGFISFMADSLARGDFYVDNVYSPTYPYS